LMEKAEQFYISATEIQPDNLEAIVELGRLYVDRGNRDGAMYYFEKAAKLFPQDKTIRKEIEALNALGKP
jgi:Flp pilus assembly protein TadD